MSFTSFPGDMARVRRPLKAAGKKFAWIDPCVIEPLVTTKVVILSSRISWIYVHRVEGRTLPCTGEGQDCHVSHAETPLLRQGWCWVWRGGSTELLHLTLTGYVLDTLPCLNDPAIDQYGQVLEIKRRDKRPFSAMLAKLGEKRKGPEVRITTPDMDEFLTRIFTAPPRAVSHYPDPKIAKLFREFAAAQEGGVA
jgi:hypothetical protein